MKKLNQPKGLSLDPCIDTLRQHYSSIHASRLILSAIETIQLAVKCGAQDVKKVARNAYENYKNFIDLVKILVKQGVILFPDNTWYGYVEMQKAFYVTYENMFARLNQETKDILQSKGITL